MLLVSLPTSKTEYNRHTWGVPSGKAGAVPTGPYGIVTSDTTFFKHNVRIDSSKRFFIVEVLMFFIAKVIKKTPGRERIMSWTTLAEMDSRKHALSRCLSLKLEPTTIPSPSRLRDKASYFWHLPGFDVIHAMLTFTRP